MKSNPTKPTKPFIELFDVILNGDKEESRKAARGVRKLLHDSKSSGQYHEIKSIIEVGAGKKDYKQIVSTSKKINPDYSLIISEDDLELNEGLNALKVPLRLFLLT